MDEKAQAMVMEVLVGVIMFAMVIVLSSAAINKIMEDQCEKEIESNINSFARSIIEIAKSNIGNSKRITLRIPECLTASARAIQFDTVNEEDICNSLCRSSAPCDVLRFRAAGVDDEINLTTSNATNVLNTWRVRNTFCLGVKLDDTSVVDNTGTSCSAANDSYSVLNVITSYEIRQTTGGLCILREVYE